MMKKINWSFVGNALVALAIIIALQPQPAAAPIVRDPSVQLASFQQQQAGDLYRLQFGPGGELIFVPANEPPVIPTDTQVPPPPPATATATNPPPGAKVFCPDILDGSHDTSVWHPHFDAARNCYNDHFHGDDPNDPAIVAIFGPWKGFSTVHATGGTEHGPKHKGDRVFVSHPGKSTWIPCDNSKADVSHVADNFGDPNKNDCIKAWRLTVHFADEGSDFLFVNHSYRIEYLVCTRASGFTDCGTMDLPGWAFFGHFRTPDYQLPPDVRPGCDPATQDCLLGFGSELAYKADGPDELNITLDEPYVQSRMPYSPALHQQLLSEPGRLHTISWSMSEIGACGAGLRFPSDGLCRNNYARFLVVGLDFAMMAREGDLNNSVKVCLGQKANCWYDNSKSGPVEVQAWIPKAWDTDGDGYVTSTIWVDRYGQPQANQLACSMEMIGATRAGDCLKMVLNHYPVPQPGGAAAQKIDAAVRPANQWFATEYNQCGPSFDCMAR